jgi:ABC-type proline/glycine betaine transport system permease subunit
MDMGTLGFLVTTVAAVMAIGLPLGVAAWRRRKSLQRNADEGR